MPQTHMHGATGAIGRAMPANTATKDTWQDWWPDEPTDPEQLLTTRELVERARTDGIAVTERDIANWQSLGMLPRGINQRAGRALQALYPPRYLDLLRDVREEQRKGTRRKAIAQPLRMKHYGKSRTAPQSAVIRVPTATATAKGERVSVRHGDPALTADNDLAQTLRTIARKHEQTYGGHIARIELRLIDDHGNPLTLTVGPD